ncbi:MAG: hypothetical protein DHS20C18_13000 [Saprospiraceae bacterium]|nr:MAG: hypothetical protein DHS20C18_13000 [Saprospiraceae bacterium]
MAINYLSILLLLLSNIMLFAQSPPNVIIILTDDQGTMDLNCYGAKDLYTPHIDGLAASGVRFTQFYAAAPVCSPSRAALLTGLNPQAAGLPGNASSIPGHGGMPTDRFTIAEMMKSAGYSTAHIGKWHLGYTPETRPNGQGFDYSFGHMGGCIDNYSHFFYWNGPNRHDLWENETETWFDGFYFPDLIEEKAKKFISNHRSTPFFMYYAINMPHYPLQPRKKWRDYYQKLDRPRQDYAAFISTIDESIGRLLQHLKSLQLLENTIIIFQSDHGHSTEERAFGGGGDAGPYRGAKFSLFEGGIRVPAIISWPGHIPAGEVRDQMALNIDWMPTIAAYCGIKAPEVEGNNLAPIIKDAQQPTLHSTFQWKSGVSWAIRKGPWKLLGYPNDTSNKGPLNPDKDRLFLVNLDKDASEMTNLASQFPDKVAELTAEYLQWPFASPEDLPKERKFIKNKAFGKQITLLQPPAEKYNAGGPGALIDQKAGTRRFNDGSWLGFEANDLEATIDLGTSQQIQAVNVGFLQDIQNWIFFPEVVEISWSADGKIYSETIKKPVGASAEFKDPTILRIQVQQEDVYARFIKVKVKNTAICPEWHQGKGSKAWLFVDEISIE